MAQSPRSTLTTLIILAPPDIDRRGGGKHHDLVFLRHALIQQALGDRELIECTDNLDRLGFNYDYMII